MFTHFYGFSAFKKIQDFQKPWKEKSGQISIFWGQVQFLDTNQSHDAPNFGPQNRPNSHKNA